METFPLLFYLFNIQPDKEFWRIGKFASQTLVSLWLILIKALLDFHFWIFFCGPHTILQTLYR